MRSIFLILLLFEILHEIRASCPREYHRIQGDDANDAICIKVLQDDPLTWNESEHHCLAENGRLYEPRSYPVYEGVVEFLKKGLGKKGFFWIGVNDFVQEDRYVYATDQSVVIFKKFVESYGVSPYEDCVGLTGKFDFKWEDSRCGKRQNFICETRSGSITVTPTTTPSPTTLAITQNPNCRSGFDLIRGKICVKIFPQKVVWKEAKKVCESQGSRLYEPPGKGINRSIIRYFRKLFGYTDRTKFFWIGVNDILVENKLVYASSFKPVSYTKFGHGQPNKKTADYEDCVGLSGRYGFRMDDKSCDLKAPFVCEMPKGGGSYTAKITTLTTPTPTTGTTGFIWDWSHFQNNFLPSWNV